MSLGDEMDESTDSRKQSSKRQRRVTAPMSSKKRGSVVAADDGTAGTKRTRVHSHAPVRLMDGTEEDNYGSQVSNRLLRSCSCSILLYFFQVHGGVIMEAH